MKIIAWNVNGIRSLLKTDNLNILMNQESPDVFCMGETKISCSVKDSVDKEIEELFPQYKYRYWSTCTVKAGYSGTAIFSKKKPINVVNGLLHNMKEMDLEGRVITMEFSKYYLVHVYTPNSGQALNRLDYRTKEWDKAFTSMLTKLQESKNVIVAGDLNVAHNMIDLKNPKTNTRTAGYTKEERESFKLLLDNTNMIDTFREKNPELIKYSYWSYMRNAREKNVGWRIDYFLVSKKLIKKVKKSDILDNIMGSDHAPIILEI
jgi:exodeoxyribonuclease-3